MAMKSVTVNRGDMVWFTEMGETSNVPISLGLLKRGGGVGAAVRSRFGRFYTVREI